MFSGIGLVLEFFNNKNNFKNIDNNNGGIIETISTKDLLTKEWNLFLILKKKNINYRKNNVSKKSLF